MAVKRSPGIFKMPGLRLKNKKMLNLSQVWAIYFIYSIRKTQTNEQQFINRDWMSAKKGNANIVAVFHKTLNLKTGLDFYPALFLFSNWTVLKMAVFYL